jgi:hypothetical protein
MGVAMTVAILAQGQLWRTAERRESRAGKHYVTATLLDADDGFFVVIAFAPDVQDELCRLDEGDSLAVQGSLRVEVYEKDGATRVCRKIIADRILALRQPGALSKRPPRRSAAPTKRRPAEHDSADAFDGASV